MLAQDASAFFDDELQSVPAVTRFRRYPDDSLG